jgi:hypothetical protein
MLEHEDVMPVFKAISNDLQFHQGRLVAIEKHLEKSSQKKQNKTCINWKAIDHFEGVLKGCLDETPAWRVDQILDSFELLKKRLENSDE